MNRLIYENALPALQGAVEEVRNSPDYRFDNARRSDAPRMVVQRTLSGDAFYRDHRGEKRVGEGQVMLFTHHEPSEYGYPPDATKPYRLRFFTLTGDSVVPLFEELRHEFGSVLQMPQRSASGALFDALFARYHERGFTDRFAMADEVFQFLTALYREQVHGVMEARPVEYGYHLIRDRFREPVSIKTLAAQCGISREHFNRAFAARYGVPPARLLRRLRLEHARGMLQATSLTLEEVALRSGFSSANAFCRAFREHFGQTPATLRT